VPDPAGLRPRARVFFALWPEADCQHRCLSLAHDLAARCAGRGSRPDTLHLTLAFLGEVERTRLDALIDAATTVTGTPFNVHLDHTGYWPRPRIAYLAPSKPPEALLRLAADLGGALATAGFSPDARAFRPHVTLVRKALCPGASVGSLAQGIDWPVVAFCLVESRPEAAGARYHTLAHLPLAGPALG